MELRKVFTRGFLLLSMAVGVAILAPIHEVKASALRIGDSNELGSLWPGVQKKTDNRDKATYVNHLLGMALGAVEVGHVAEQHRNRERRIPRWSLGQKDV